MSYQLLKRFLGETNLEWKCYLLFGACFFVLITASFWCYGQRTERIVWEQMPNAARLLVEGDMLSRHWKGMEEEEDEKKQSWPKAEQMVEAMSESFSHQPYMEVRFILPKPPAAKGPEHDKFAPRDKFEKEWLERFLKNQPHKPGDTPEFAQRRSADGNYYYYYQPIYAIATECYATCHQPMTNVTGGLVVNRGALGYSFAESKGDLMAMVELTLSTKDTRRAINLNLAILVATAIITFFLAMVASYVIVRYVIVKPLRHLRNVSDAISRGNTSLRAEIHTGDEFDELAAAFNRMLGHLTTAQEELRGANTTLDAKVDELAQTNMRLYEMNMDKSSFLATMSHELRTPLNSILGFSEVLDSIDSLSEKQKRYVQNIQKSGKMLLEMINDVLDLAKIESGKMQPRPAEFRIEQVVAGQCDMARLMAEKKNIDLETRVEPDLPPVHQDQARVQQILNNLLSNAIKFTPDGGRIIVSAGRGEAGFLVLHVTDTGVGIAADEQAVIFEKFRQGRTAMPGGDAMTREHSGSGLGLSIVKELCRLLGGEVLLHSELGKGSTFTVRLPWVLQEESRVDPAIVADLEEFTKQRFDLRGEAGG
jgi:signal transduction histidine kinase